MTQCRSILLLANAEYALGRLEGATGRVLNPYLIGQPLLRREAMMGGNRNLGA